MDSPEEAYQYIIKTRLTQIKQSKPLSTDQLTEHLEFTLEVFYQLFGAMGRVSKDAELATQNNIQEIKDAFEPMSDLLQDLQVKMKEFEVWQASVNEALQGITKTLENHEQALQTIQNVTKEAILTLTTRINNHPLFDHDAMNKLSNLMTTLMPTVIEMQKDINEVHELIPTLGDALNLMKQDRDDVKALRNQMAHTQDFLNSQYGELRARLMMLEKIADQAGWDASMFQIS